MSGEGNLESGSPPRENVQFGGETRNSRENINEKKKKWMYRLPGLINKE